jgi:hypothetical protein
MARKKLDWDMIKLENAPYIRAKLTEILDDPDRYESFIGFLERCYMRTHIRCPGDYGDGWSYNQIRKVVASEYGFPEVNKLTGWQVRVLVEDLSKGRYGGLPRGRGIQNRNPELDQAWQELRRIQDSRFAFGDDYALGRESEGLACTETYTLQHKSIFKE